MFCQPKESYMKFKKISDTSFEWTLTREEMDEFDISIEDFVSEKGKAMEFMRKLFEMSMSEMNIEINGSGVISAQVMPTEDDGMRLIMSTADPTNSLDFLRFLKDMILAKMGTSVEKLGLPNKDRDKPPTPEEVRQEIDKIFEDEDKPKKGRKSSSIDVKTRLYSFENLKAFEQFALSQPVKEGFKNSLMYDEKENRYYLAIDKGNLGTLEYARLCESLIEFGFFETDDERRIAFLSEHAKSVFAKDAIKRINEII